MFQTGHLTFSIYILSFINPSFHDQLLHYTIMYPEAPIFQTEQLPKATMMLAQFIANHGLP